MTQGHNYSAAGRPQGFPYVHLFVSSLHSINIVHHIFILNPARHIFIFYFWNGAHPQLARFLSLQHIICFSHTQNLSGQAVQLHRFFIHMLFLDVWEEVAWDRLGSISSWSSRPYWPSHSAEKQEGSLSIMSMWCNLSALVTGLLAHLDVADVVFFFFLNILLMNCSPNKVTLLSLQPLLSLFSTTTQQTSQTPLSEFYEAALNTFCCFVHHQRTETTAFFTCLWSFMSLSVEKRKRDTEGKMNGNSNVAQRSTDCTAALCSERGSLWPAQGRVYGAERERQRDTHIQEVRERWHQGQKGLLLSSARHRF